MYRLESIKEQLSPREEWVEVQKGGGLNKKERGYIQIRWATYRERRATYRERRGHIQRRRGGAT